MRVTQWIPTLTHTQTQTEGAVSTYRAALRLAGCPRDFVSLETAGNVWRQARDAAEHFTVPRLALQQRIIHTLESLVPRSKDLPANLSGEEALTASGSKCSSSGPSRALEFLLHTSFHLLPQAV